MKLIYDVTSLPKGLPVSDLIKVFDNHSVVFWDSTKGIKPKLYTEKEEKFEFTIVDTNGKDIDIEQYQKEYAEKEYWEKELFNCKNSPIYFYSHYGATEFPITNKGIKEFLVSIGLSELSVKDSGKATAAWEKQKEIVKAIGSNYTIPYLKALSEDFKLRQNTWEELIQSYEFALGKSIILVDKKGDPLPENKKKGKVMEAIHKHPVPDKYKNYLSKKKSWDASMLSLTDYKNLLIILNDLQNI